MVPKRRIIPLFIPHAGCTHDCVFCDQRRISGAAAHSSIDGFHSAPLGIENDTENSQPVEIAFYGGSFTALPAKEQTELLEAAQPILELSRHNSIRISTRPDHIDRQIVERLEKAGVRTIELGAQSMSDDVLSKSRRGHMASDVAQAADVIKNAGIALILQMMTGLPGDSPEKSIYTAKRFVDLGPDGVRIYPTVVVQGTQLHEMWLRGEYKEHTIEDAIDICTELCAIFEDAGIPVIRLGLNPTEMLSAGEAVAGAYHPALGELVYSQIYYNKAAALISGAAPESEVRISVAKGKVSIMAGHRRQNILALKKNFALKSLVIIGTDAEPGEIKIEITKEREYNIS